MNQLALITGITGQDGSYLAEYLLKKKYQVVGLVSPRHNIGFQNIDHFKDKLILEPGDLVQKDSLLKIIKRFRPAEIYNLAGLTFGPIAWEKPTLAFDINTLGTSRLLEIIRDYSPETKFYQATSAKIFGNPQISPQTESTPIKPIDPYGVSKACSHYLTQNFRAHFGLFAVSGILYNHESERRGQEFVTRKITSTACRIKLGLTDKLVLGRLEAKQYWGYAPDYVKAMWLMLQQTKPDDYIIASGRLHSVRDVCQIAFSYLGLDYQKYVKVDKKFYRKTEAKALFGNPTKASQDLGWKPQVNFKNMIIKMVKNDLQLLKQ